MNKNLAAIGWIAMASLIFYASSQPYSKQDMRAEISLTFAHAPQVLVQIMDRISFSYAGKVVSLEALGMGGLIEFLIRKCAHFGAFFLLAFFFYVFIRHLVPSNWKSTVITGTFTIFYAASDEFHQMLTGGRTPLIHDVCLDSIGGIFGILFGYCMMQIYMKKHDLLQ